MKEYKSHRPRISVFLEMIFAGKTHEILSLDRMIEAESFNADEFQKIVDRFLDLNNAKLKLVDFAWYNEKRRNKFKRLELKYRRMKEYVKAEEYKALVKKCDRYIELRKFAKIKNSSFFFDDVNLCFFHTGTGRNDPEIREFVARIIDETQKKQDKIRKDLETFAPVIAKINKLLNSEEFELDDFKNTWDILGVDLKANLKFLDFLTLNEARAEEMRQEKMKHVRLQDFEKAAEYRMFEKVCLDHIKMKNDEKIKISEFRFDGEAVSYWYMGNARNDMAVAQFLGKQVTANL
jgi:hypothetical protein